MTLLADLNLRVEAGEALGLTGDAGSGKTTLLRLIAGLTRAAAGRVYVAGKDLTALGASELQRHAGRLGVVFQDLGVVPFLTVEENIARSLRGEAAIGWRQVQKRVQELLEAVEMSGMGTRSGADLDLARQKRVALARALALRPDILLCDAWTAGLDPRESEAARRLLRRLHERLRLNTVLATRDVGAAFDVADRVAVLARGRIAWEQPTARGETAATRRLAPAR